MKNCAYCGRENSEDSTRCTECGTAFVPQQNPQRAAAERRMLYGVLWCSGGIAVLLVNHWTTGIPRSGHSYGVGWVAVLVGVVRFVQGLCARIAQR
jgi:hypothetical protein